MDNQLVQSPFWGQRLFIVIIAIAALLCVAVMGIYWYQSPDPYIREVFALEGDRIQGQAIFQINCAGCHGLQADGSVGPSLKHIPRRKSKTDLIHQVTSGNTPPMPKFQPSPQEMADLLMYLEKL